MQTVLLFVSLLFIIILAALTGLDIAHYGLTGLDVIAVLVLIIFMTGIVGALTHRRGPPPPPSS